MGATLEMGCQQKLTEFSTQLESEFEEIDNGLRMDKIKLEKKMWKFQARNVGATMGTNKGLTKLRKPGSFMEWEFPKTKRSKMNSPKYADYSPQCQKTNVIASYYIIFENELSNAGGSFKMR